MLLFQVPQALTRLCADLPEKLTSQGLHVELLRDINVNDKIILPARVRTLHIQTVLNINKTIWPKSDIN